MVSFVALPLRAQIPDFPDSLGSQRFSGRTERFGTTHTTGIEGDYTVQQDRITTTVRGVFLSSTTLLEEPSTKDQFDGMFDLEYLLPIRTRLFVRGEGTLTNDFVSATSLIPRINNTAGGFLGVGQRYYDSTGNRLGVAIGGAYNRQLNVENAGLGIYAEGAARIDLEGYHIRLDGTGRFYNTAPRQNANLNLSLMAQRQFEEGGYANIRGGYDLIATDLYIKRREEDIVQYGGLTYDGLQVRSQHRLLLDGMLGYPAGEDIGFDLGISFADQSRSVYETNAGLPPLPRDPEPYRHDRSDFDVGGSIGLHWLPRYGSWYIRMEYARSEEANVVQPTAEVTDLELQRKRQTDAQNDFITQNLVLSTTAEYRTGIGDTLSAVASIGILRYDTPSPTNYFDRDEQVIRAQFRFATMLSSMLTASVTAQIFITHLVYLSGQNSNDNNRNRVFRINSLVDYRLSERVMNTLETEVSANYTQYDFEGRTQNIRGRSFRELRLRDSLTLGFRPTLWLCVSGELRIADRGSFSWQQFAERPLERIRTEVLDAELQSTRIPGVQIGGGVRIARVENDRTTLTALLAPYSTHTSIGPAVNLMATLSEQTDIRCSGWWEHRFEGNTLVAKVPTFLLTVGVRL